MTTTAGETISLNAFDAPAGAIAIVSYTAVDYQGDGGAAQRGDLESVGTFRAETPIAVSTVTPFLACAAISRRGVEILHH